MMEEAAAQKKNQSTSGSNATKSNAINIPQLSLPKGGGALKGIDEKFSVNAANGTASFSIPLPVTPGRNGFQPALALTYNSGGGNSVFGLGWDVDYPSIQRKTDKKLPQYFDIEESDVFMFSGAEDLVPVLKQEDNEWIKDEETTGGFYIRRYRPRIEGLFARIERIQPVTENTFYWKVTGKDNTVTFFGRSRTHRIANPADERKIFSWLPEISFDDKGNCILFEYKEENIENVPNGLNEKNRIDGIALFTNRYLKRVKYGNIQAFYPDYSATQNIYNTPLPSATEFLFELVFDYGEHGNNQNTETAAWPVRTDPFSDYRAGFEIRTWRLCKRIMMFHHFTNREFELDDNDERIAYLVRSLDLDHVSSSQNSNQPSEVTYLSSVKQTSFKKNGSTYINKSLPAIEFTYELLNWDTTTKIIDPESMINSPTGLSNNYNWVDLYNEGLPGILTEQAAGWYYKNNFGDGKFSAAHLISPKPSFTGLSASLQLQDLDADGNKQIVSLAPGINGFYELTDDNEWDSFQSFIQIPNINWGDVNTRMIDLNGDGKADVLITEDNVFGWYPSAGKKGYGAKETIANTYDENKGPAIVFADEKQTIFLADMCGDGLTDIVRIRNGEICYWPNMGYGKFGAKVAMNKAPLFDTADNFNPAYLHLADISGTGATDLLYLGQNNCKAWLNLSGNAWSSECSIVPFFTTEQPNNISVIDLLGNGTSCIVWSSPLPANASNPMRYIDLMGGKKPHVMVSYKNNFGKQTSFEYKSSSKYYIDDKKNGNPWITKLPFPVQCVSKVVITDSVSNLRFANKYVYHHGYYDHAEREFRGFGMVEQTDTEEFELLFDNGVANATASQYHEPPVLTKTWFHLGAYFRNKKILEHYEYEYWYNNALLVERFGSMENKEYHLPDALFIGELSPQELREAHRACKGMVLRQETFALDGTDKELLPYSVATHNCHIKKLQPATGNRYAVFMVQESEAISFSYERNIDDARVAHSLNIEVDDMGNVLKNAAVVYARKERPAELTDDRIWNEQNKIHIIYSENSFTNDILSPHAYRLRLPFKAKQFEVTGATPSAGNYFSIRDFLTDAAEISYEMQPTDGTIQKRCIEEVKTIYLNDSLASPMPEGEHDTLGMSYENYQLAFTPTLLDDIYKEGEESKVNASMLAEAKYFDLNSDGNWWVRSGTIQYINEEETAADAAERFYLPQSYTDPFGTITTVSYYPQYGLLLRQTTDAMDNSSIVEHFDFRVLAPVRMKDANANITEAAIDIFGLPAGVAIMGKGDDADNLNGFEPDADDTLIHSFFEDPAVHAATLLGNATTRTVYDFTVVPCVSATIVREKHVAALSGDEQSKLQYSFDYTDGMGNIALKKIQAEPGEDELPRWVGNGRTVLNNKGKPVKQYEPYFSTTHLYEDDAAVRETGVTPILHYDAAGRLVKTEMPDGTFSKVEYDSWKQLSYDANDTVADSDWYKKRIAPAESDIADFERDGKDAGKEKAAAEKAALHYNTPAVIHLDSLGRTFCSVAHNKRKQPGSENIIEEFYSTFSRLDIESNLQAVIDAAGNTVMQYKYDILGHQLYSLSMDAGKRWMLNDCMGKPVFAWDAKQQQFSTTYDVLHRPVTSSLIKGGNTTIISRQEYKDTKDLSPAALVTLQQLNLIGASVAQYDSAGITKLLKADFKGNVLETSRQLCKGYKTIPNWNIIAANEMEEEIFISSGKFDALNRPVEMHTPHTEDIPASVMLPEYNEANMLEGMKANIRNDGETVFVTDINYDAKGQRESIYYSNNTVTRYKYDTKTFRLIRLHTTKRNTEGAIEDLQDIHYTYDAVGNITFIKDTAQPVVFFNGEEVKAESEYEYDAIYQLIKATGREHIGQNNVNETTTNNNNRNFPFENGLNANDTQALRNYTQQYLYDSVGNILQMQHIANAGSWTRQYWYNNNDADRNEAGVDPTTIKNNQLLQTQIGAATVTRYTHDIHGNMLNLPHLQAMIWNYKDELQQVDLGGGGNAFYAYDGSGQRMKKIIERSDGSKEERLYLGAVEIYREKNNAGITIKQTDSLHIMDDTRRIAMIDIPVVIPEDSEETQVIRFIYSNHLGSSSLELNENAVTISYEEYHPYGTTSFSATNAAIKVAAKRYRYTGMERDEETGMAYHSARYYLNWLGRWLSADPIGIEGGINLYEYTGASPLMYSDCHGTEKDSWDITVDNGIDTSIVKGGSIVDQKVYDSEGNEIGKIDIGKAEIEFNPVTGKFKVSLGLMDVEADAKITDDVAFTTTGKAIVLEVTQEKVEAVLFEAGVGLKVGPVAGRLLFGLGLGFQAGEGKIKLKAIAGIGGEIEVDYDDIAEYFSEPDALVDDSEQPFDETENGNVPNLSYTSRDKAPPAALAKPKPKAKPKWRYEDFVLVPKEIIRSYGEEYESDTMSINSFFGPGAIITGSGDNYIWNNPNLRVWHWSQLEYLGTYRDKANRFISDTWIYRNHNNSEVINNVPYRRLLNYLLF